jgi:hypothetical protein
MSRIGTEHVKRLIYVGKSLGKSEKQRLLSEIKSRWKDNIKIGDKLITCEDVDWN